MTFVDTASSSPDQDSVPYAEDMFPDRPEEKGIAHASADDLPYAEDMFPDHPLPGTKGAVAPGPVGDWLFSNTQHSSLARIMHAFGQGVEHAVGPHGENLKLSEKTEKELKQLGVFNDYAAGQYNVLKGLNETLLRGGAVMVNSAIYGIPVAISGIQGAIAEAGEQAEQTKAGKAIGARSLAREIASAPEAFPDFNFRGGMPHRPLPEPLAIARDLDVIGPGGEAAWKGLAPVEETKTPVAGETAVEAPPVVEAPPPPAIDVHAAARAIDPKTFAEYDALAKRRDTFRKWIEDPEDAGRDLSKVATNLKETEARLKELEPAVTQAYGEAREGIEPEPAAAVEAVEPKAAAEAPPTPEPAPAAMPAAPRVTPIAEQKANIAADVQRQIIAAGKPESMTQTEWRQHAEDSGKLAAARYEARAAWFEGKRGTAQDLYEREAPEILGHGQRSQENVTPRVPRKVDEEKLSLAQFLAHRGGLQETPDLRHILDQNPFIPGFGRLFRRDGMTEDRAREAASEAGYLTENQERTGKQATIRDLYDALSEENRGRKRYRQGHEPETAGREGPEHEEFPEGLEPHEMAAAEEDQLGHLSEEDRAFLQTDAYHGSPHHFERFDIGKIGTGEGAQVYGHGLYFAEREGVAKSYREALAGAPKGLNLLLDGKANWDLADIPAGDRAGLHELWARISSRRHDTQVQIDKSITDARGMMDRTIENYERQHAKGQSLLGKPIEWEKHDLDAVRQARRLLDEGRIQFTPPEKPGALYKVSLKPDKTDLLDWDKPISEQSEKIQKAILSKIGEPSLSKSNVDWAGDMVKLNGRIVSEIPKGQAVKENLWDYVRGRDVIQQLSPDPATQSKILSESGIPGIKYADQGSRGSEGGTHNFVIFDDKDVEITHKNGEPVTTKERTEAVNELFQRGEQLNQSARGSVQFRENQAPVMRILRAANASTYIHESGHVFLEELMRDAAHEAAPETLKADAKTVRDWLGIESHADLNTGWPGARGRAARAAHEKFATAFEQYLREGVAPSKELAAVFARFRDWLIKLYDTIAGLGHPINEDIRQVFDRLLAKEPERTVIAPERAMEPGFEDIHEAHAEAAPPEQARKVANTIQSERDSQAPHDLIKNPDARLENVEPGTGSRAPGSTEPPSDANATGSPSGSPGASAEAGKIGEGGSEVAAEGDRVPPKPESAVKSEPPAGPNAKFDTSSSGLVDKAGNIRLDKLATGDDVLDVIREAARANNDFLAERRGVLSDGDTLNLSDALGMDPAWLDRKKIGEAFNVEEIRAARRLLVQSATTVRDAMIAAKNGATESVMKLAEAIARHEMIQGKVAQATAEAGRALRAFREFIPGQENIGGLNEWLKQNTGRTLFQLQEMAKYGATLSSPATVSRFVHDTANGKIKQAIIYYYVNALISGPVTHLRYAAGNALTSIWTPLVKIPFAAGSGAVREMVGYERDAERVYLGESGAQLYGLVKGSREGLRAAIEGWRTGNTPHLPGEGAPNMFEAQPVLPPIPGKVGYVIGLPGKSVGAIHGFFSALRYEQEINGAAYRSAMKEGLSGDAFASHIADLANRPTQEMMENASTQARKDLYMAPADYQSFEAKLARLANQNLLTKVLMPFVKIGTQIVRTAMIESTPLGAFDKKVRENLSGKNGNVAREMQAGQIAAGSALMAVMAGMVTEGLATGDGPSDPEKRAVWLLNHHPNSIQIGDISVSYERLGALGMLMRTAANATETARGWGDDEAHVIVTDFLYGMERAILGESFLTGIKDFIDAVYHHEEYGAKYAAQMVTNWIPFSVGLGQVSRLADPYQRETRGNDLLDGIWKEAIAKAPLLSETLQPRRDMFGEPVPAGGKIQNYANDKTVQAMNDLHMKVGRLQRKIRGVALTDKQYDDYARTAGRTAKLMLDSMMQTAGRHLLATGKVEDRAKVVDLMHKAITHAREDTAKVIMEQAYGGDNDILNKAKDAKMIKKGAVAPPAVH